MFVVILDYVAPLADIEAALTAHRAWLERHYAAGRFLLSGPMVPRHGGVILAHGVDRAGLEALIADDPFHNQGLARHRVIEVTPGRSDPRLGFLTGPAAASDRP